MTRLDPSDVNWQAFFQKYLQSIRHIVGEYALAPRDDRPSESLPSSFLSELEGLRAQVEILNEEVRVFFDAFAAHSYETLR
jgi:hypothetical protein